MQSNQEWRCNRACPRTVAVHGPHHRGSGGRLRARQLQRRRHTMRGGHGGGRVLLLRSPGAPALARGKPLRRGGSCKGLRRGPC